MRALPAIYENGRVTFQFTYPEYEGPVSVLVIFPDVERWEDPVDRDPADPVERGDGAFF